MEEDQQQHQQDVQQQQPTITEVSAVPASIGPHDIILGGRGGERRGIEGRGIIYQIPGTDVVIRLREYYHQINSGHFYRGYLGNNSAPSLAVKCIYLFQYEQHARDIDNEILIRTFFEQQSSVEVAFDNHVILPEYVLTNRFQEGIDTFEKYFFIISPLANIGDIFDLLDIRELEENDVKQLFKQMVQVIAYLHSKNIFHSDLKPDNFAINSNDVYVIDFGKASIENERRMPYQDGFRYGTPIYSPPELNPLFLDPTQSIDWRKADVWALGVSLFSIMMGQNPPWVCDGEVANPLDVTFQCICRQRRLADFLAYNTEDFVEISTEATDLLQMMLIENPDDRISVDEILSHPWMN